MLTTIVILLTLTATYVVASDVIFLVLHRLLKRGPGESALWLFFLTRGTGPVLFSLLIYVFFLVLPGHGRGLYVALSLGALGGLALWGIPGLAQLWAAYRAVGQKLRSVLRWTASSPPLLAALLLVLAATVFAVGFPITEHDSLSVAIEARIMLREMSMENYLAVNQPDAQTGYFLRTFRTPFQQTLYVWFALAGGIERMDLMARTVSPVYGIYCVLLLGFLVSRARSARDAAWAVFLLASTPYFFYMSYNNGIDPQRLFLILAVLAGFAELIDREKESYRLAVLVGVFSGAAIWVHLLDVFAVAAGGLTLLVSRRWSLRRRMLAGALIAAVAVLAGAQFHYLLHPRTAGQFRASMSMERMKEEWKLFFDPPKTDPQPKPSPLRRNTTAPPRPTAGAPPPTAATSPESVAEVLKRTPPALRRDDPFLELRGQGGSPLRRFLFGRLQMFTGIESFGAIFYLFWASFLLWLRGPSKTTLEKVMAWSALAGCVLILSGVRNLSWSNPRYIASLLVIAAGFAAPLVSTAEDFLRQRRLFRGRKSLVAWTLVAFLAFPTILGTSIRGAKVELTNPGSFYKDFRSLKWMRYAFEDPGGALRRFWQDYLGIRKTLRYFWADDETKLRHSHDYFAGVQYVNEHTPADAKVFLFRDVRFFYYAERRGVVWYSPEVDRRSYLKKSAGDLCRYLSSEGFTHVLLDSVSTLRWGYLDSAIGEMLADPRYSEVVYELGTAKVYRLRGDCAETGPGASAGRSDTPAPRP